MKVIVTSDVLVNQLRRDSVLIAESFDSLCSTDLQEISALYSEASAILLGAAQDLERFTPVQAWAVEVLINVAGSISAAALVLRAGYTLVPGVVLRNSVEAMAVCLHGLLQPDDLKKIRSGDFNTPSAITTAKRVIPPIGHMNGLLSNLFIHISPLHQKIKPLVPYTDRKAPALDLNLKTLRAVVWLFYVVSEFTFVSSVGARARYWKFASPNTATFDPSAEERRWMKQFLEDGGVENRTQDVQPTVQADGPTSGGSSA